jgi:hypothetical protein
LKDQCKEKRVRHRKEKVVWVGKVSNVKIGEKIKKVKNNKI